MSKLSEITNAYLNKWVTDKNGIRAQVTGVKQLPNRQPNKEPLVQMELNGRITMGWQEFERSRKFRVDA